MIILEKPIIRGHFNLQVYRKGKLAEKHEDRNMITNAAHGVMARLLAGNFTDRNISKIAFGTSGNVPAPGNTEIQNPFVKPLGTVSFPSDNAVQFSWLLLETEANGLAIREFGLLCENDTLFARRNRAEPINKNSDIALEGQWIIEFAF
jgi:hypothetical protein